MVSEDLVIKGNVAFLLHHHHHHLLWSRPAALCEQPYEEANMTENWQLWPTTS